MCPWNVALLNFASEGTHHRKAMLVSLRYDSQIHTRSVCAPCMQVALQSIAALGNAVNRATGFDNNHRSSSCVINAFEQTDV